MTDRDYDAVQNFHEKVRQAYREFLEEAEDPEEAVYLAQDGLSLFSPWMNATVAGEGK